MTAKVHRPKRSTAVPRGAWARFVNMGLGLWLIISAFVWPHTLQGQTDAWAIGSLIFVCSLWALLNPAVRWLNALLAIWLFFTAISIPWISKASPVNDAIVAIVVFLLTWVPGDRLGPRELRV